MGACLSSGRGGHLEQVDDSVHVMLKHDRKKRKESGQAAASGYKPRATNPALEKKRVEEANNGNGITANEEEETTEETA